MSDTKFNFTRRGLVKARLEVVKKNTNKVAINLDSVSSFFLNPSSYTESKAANWVVQNVPGLSDPHQQWTSSGARTITFEAYVSNDLAEGHVNTKASDARKNNAANKTSVIKRLGKIATRVFNVGGLDLNGVAQVNNNAGLSLDISEKLNYYRSLCYPDLQSDANRVDSAPAFVKLKVGTTFGKRTLNTAIFVVNKVDIIITKQYPDLTPIEAKVTFTLTEFVGGVLGANNNIISDA